MTTSPVSPSLDVARPGTRYKSGVPSSGRGEASPELPAKTTEQPAESCETGGRDGRGSTAMFKDAGTAEATGIAQVPATTAREDRVLMMGWKYDPARDRLSSEARIYTYRTHRQLRPDRAGVAARAPGHVLCWLDTPSGDSAWHAARLRARKRARTAPGSAAWPTTCGRTSWCWMTSASSPWPTPRGGPTARTDEGCLERKAVRPRSSARVGRAAGTALCRMAADPWARLPKIVVLLRGSPSLPMTSGSRDAEDAAL